MKRFFLDFAVVLLSVVCVDVLVGHMTDRLLMGMPNCDNELSHTKASFFDQSGDILILGSSRAVRHYDPEILGEELEMTCYNAGMDGKDIIYSYAVLASSVERYVPKIVILDITASSIDGSWDDTIFGIKCFYDINGPTREILDHVSSTEERLSLCSGLYRANDLPFRLMKTYMIGEKEFSGYLPLSGTADYLQAEHVESGVFEFDGTAREYLMKIVSICRENHIRLLVCNSPSLSIANDNMMDAVRQLAGRDGIIYIDKNNCPEYTGHPELFKDMIHLNSSGAAKYTREIAGILKNETLWTKTALSTR